MSSTNAYSIKKPAVVVTLKDLFETKQDNAMRLTASEFGGKDNVFVGRAVGWKGKKGSQFEATAPKGVQDGLAKAKAISIHCAGQFGVGTYGGRRLPNKVICQMMNATPKSPADRARRRKELANEKKGKAY